MAKDRAELHFDNIVLNPVICYIKNTHFEIPYNFINSMIMTGWQSKAAVECATKKYYRQTPKDICVQIGTASEPRSDKLQRFRAYTWNAILSTT